MAFPWPLVLQLCVERKEIMLRETEHCDREHLRLSRKTHQSIKAEIYICVQNKTNLVNINERSFEGTVPWHLAGFN